MIRKKLLMVAAIIVFMMGIFHIKANLKNEDLLDLTLANIEALAQNEGGGGGSKCTNIGYERVWSDGCLYECIKCAEGYYQAIGVIECIAR